MSSLSVNKRVAVKVIEAFQGLPHRMTEIPGFEVSVLLMILRNKYRSVGDAVPVSAKMVGCFC